MKYKFDRNAHSVYTLNYHFIQCVKYRKNIFVNDLIIDALKVKTIKIAEIYEIKIINMETDKNHIHILFSAKPQTNLIKFINSWKSVTAREMRKKFPEIKGKLWNGVFWSNSYCLITTGQVTLDALKKYVEGQGK